MAGSPTIVYPCANHNISDGYWEHVDRGSVNPGTDFTCAYGSDTWAAKTGTITSLSTSTAGSGGRFITIQYDDGTSSQYLHLSQIDVSRGDRVAVYQHVAYTGASAYGSNYGTGGPHLHFTYRIGGINVDPMLYIIGSSGAGGGDYTPLPNMTPEQEELAYLMTVADDIVADLKARLLESEARTAQKIIEARDWLHQEVSGRIDNKVLPGIDTRLPAAIAAGTLSVTNAIQRERVRLYTITGSGSVFGVNLTSGTVTEYKGGLTDAKLLAEVAKQKVGSYVKDGKRIPDNPVAAGTRAEFDAFVFGLVNTGVAA